MAATKQNSVYLTSSDHWKQWDREFRTEAVARNLWPCIDSNVMTPFKREPIMPTWKNYPKKGLRIGRRTATTSGTAPALGAASASEDAFSITVNTGNEG